MRNIVAELRALADREGIALPDDAADEIERLRARVTELEAARVEPVAWQYKVTCERCMRAAHRAIFSMEDK